MKNNVSGPSVAPPAQNFGPLALALVQCLALIGLGAVCRGSALFSRSDTAGLSAFVGRLALPAQLFLSLAAIELDSIDWALFASVAATKLVCLVGAVATCCALAAAEWGGWASDGRKLAWCHSAALNAMYSSCHKHAPAVNRMCPHMAGAAPPGSTPSSSPCPTISRWDCRSWPPSGASASRLSSSRWRCCSTERAPQPGGLLYIDPLGTCLL